MKLRLLEHIACPACRSTDLTLESSDATSGEIETGNITCSACGVKYPIVGGIPRLFPEAWRYFPGGGSSVDVASQHASVLRQTIENYSAYQGKVYAPLADRLRNEQILEARSGLAMSDFAGTVCIDAGCGVGRFARTMARAGARLVIAFDAGYAVEVARSQSGEFENIEWVQADIMRPPFREETAERVISIGVLNLTGKPDLGFQNLSKLVKRGGTFTIYIHLCDYIPWDKLYSVKTSLGRLYDIAVKERFRRTVAKMPDGMRLSICRSLWRFRCLVAWLETRGSPGRVLARLLAKFGPMYSNKPLESAESNIARNFDSYSTPNQHTNELSEVIDWFEKTRRYRRIRFTPFRQSVTGWAEEPREDTEPMLIEYFPAKSIEAIEAAGVEA